MATPTSRKEPSSTRFAVTEDRPENPQAKKSRANDDRITLATFKMHAERGLDLWVTHGIISQNRKIELLAPYSSDEKGATLSLKESTTWYTSTLKSVVDRIVAVSQNHFIFKCSEVESGKEFRAQANSLLVAYISHLKKTLHDCAEASLKNGGLNWVYDHGPLLPLLPGEPVQQNPCNEPCQLNRKLKVLFEFFMQRKTIFASTEIGDDFETIIRYLWKKENQEIYSLAIGIEALNWGHKFCLQLQKGDYSFDERKKWLIDRIERFSKGVRHTCVQASKIDFATECFKANVSSEDYHFPISTVLKDPFVDPCVSSARRIRDWMHRYQTQFILRDVPEFSTLIRNIQQWATSNLNGDLLKRELEACEAIKSMRTKDNPA